MHGVYYLPRDNSICMQWRFYARYKSATVRQKKNSRVAKRIRYGPCGYDRPVNYGHIARMC